jgi:uncharacterized protein YjbI with pentapeptide repeats
MNRLRFTFLPHVLLAGTLFAQSPTRPESLYSKDIYFQYFVDATTGLPVREEARALPRSVIKIYPNGQANQAESIGQFAYYGAAEMDEIIDELDQHHEIRDAFIEVLDLQQLAAWFRERYYPAVPQFPLKFYNCYIKRLLSAQGSEEVVKLTQPLIFEEVSVGLGWMSVDCPRLEFINTDLLNTLFINSTLHHFHFARTYAAQSDTRAEFNNYKRFDPAARGRYGISFLDCRFEGHTFFSFTQLERVQFEHCEFLSPAHFAPNPYFQHKFLNAYRAYLKRVGTDPLHYYQLKGNLPDRLNPYVLSQFSFDNSTFQDVSFAGVVLDGCSFNNTRFKQSVNLTGTRVWADTTLNRRPFPSRFHRAHFDDDAVLHIDVRNRSLDSLALRLDYLSQLRFELNLPQSTLSEHDHDHINLVFNSLINYVVDPSTPGTPEAKEAALDHLTYQRNRFEMRYDRSNWRQAGPLANFLRLGFLELTVRNGHHGELRFLSICFGLVTLFALLYWIVPYVQYHRQKPAVKQPAPLPELVVDSAGALALQQAQPDPTTQPLPAVRYQNPIVNLVLGENRPNDVISLRRRLRDLAVCYWFSVTLFLRINFPSEYFRLNPRWLFVTVFTEWAVGLVMTALFLLYIAGKLPFVRTLLGL